MTPTWKQQRWDGSRWVDDPRPPLGATVRSWPLDPDTVFYFESVPCVVSVRAGFAHHEPAVSFGSTAERLAKAQLAALQRIREVM